MAIVTTDSEYAKFVLTIVRANAMYKSDNLIEAMCKVIVAHYIVNNRYVDGELVARFVLDMWQYHRYHGLYARIENVMDYARQGLEGSDLEVLEFYQPEIKAYLKDGRHQIN